MSIVICATCVNRELWKLLLLTVIPFEMMQTTPSPTETTRCQLTVIWYLFNKTAKESRRWTEKKNGIKRTRNMHEHKRQQQQKKHPHTSPVYYCAYSHSALWHYCIGCVATRRLWSGFFVFFIMNSNKWNITIIIMRAASMRTQSIFTNSRNRCPLSCSIA